MKTQRSRIVALAAVAALAMAGPAWAQGEAQVPNATVLLNQGMVSNRLTTSAMWTQFTDSVHELRGAVAAEQWDAALPKVREVRGRIDRMMASKVIDHEARLLVSELRPFVVELEERLVQGRGRGLVRGVDAFLAHINRTQGELLAAGHIERMGGGAGPWRLPGLPRTQANPQPVPVAPPPTDENLERPTNDRPQNQDLSPGNERNQMDEWREPID